MRYTYNKLVRDKIPNNINRQTGKKAIYRTMDNEEYLKELNRKVLEEAQEFIEANDIEELADVVEVIESIMRAKGISWDEVRRTQEEKRNKRGGFQNKVYLEYVEEEEIER